MLKEDTTKKRAKKASPSIGCRRWTLQLNSFILAILCWISRKLKFNEHSLLYFCKEFNESGVDVFVTGHWMSSGWTQCELYETSSRDKNLNDTIHMLLRRLFILHDSIMILSWFFCVIICIDCSLLKFHSPTFWMVRDVEQRMSLF